MFLLKETVVLGLVLLCTSYVSTMDFSDMDLIHDEVMKYYTGTERTVQVLKPKFVAPPPVKNINTRRRKFKKVFPKGRPGAGGGGRVKFESKVFIPKVKKGRPGPMGPKKKKAGGGGSRGSAGGGGPHFSIFPMSLKPDLSLGLSPVRPKNQKPKLTFIEQTKTYKRRRTPSNKFLEAVTAIQRGTAEAKAAEKWRKKKQSVHLQATKKALKLATQNRMFQYARHKLGRALYYIKQNSIRRSKRSTQTQVSNFMRDLKLSMGAEKFDEFMAVMGDVTLMFAIDTTGSMSDEIETSKRIAVDVINYPRDNPVSYILSPFNDPKTGPVTFKNSTEGAPFVEAIDKLKAHGGGDCPEKTMTGILDALYEGPDWGSPLYVFTDASAKDDAQTNIEEIKEMAKLQGNTINFFTTGSHCRQPNYKSFQELSDATSGQVLSLSNNQELQQLTGFTGSVLGGSNVISSGSNMSNRKKRRAAGDHRYSIKVDDSIEKMSVCITTTRPNQGATISLIKPGGVKITSGKISMSKISVYEMTNPVVGTWTLVIPSNCGTHSYYVKSTSDTNIDFEHYFMQSMPGPITDVPVSDPLIGRQTKVILTLAGYDKVQKNTVVLELITKYGEHIRDVTLQPDKRGMRYVATITPPSRPFKLKIKGTTKTGNQFERVSRNVIEPKHVLLRVLRSDRDFTLRRSDIATVTFHIFNGGANSQMKIAVKDRLGYAAPVSRSSRRVRRGRWAFFRVMFNVPSSAKIGASDTAMVSVSYNNGAGIVMAPVQLLVVA